MTMFGPDELLFFDNRLVPGRTTRAKAFALLGRAGFFSKHEDNERFAIWVVREIDLTVGISPIYQIVLYFSESVVARIQCRFESENFSEIRRTFRAQFGEGEVLRSSPRIDWANSQSGVILRHDISAFEITHIAGYRQFLVDLRPKGNELEE